MLVAANRIEHGGQDKSGKNIVTVIEAGQGVKDLPADVLKALQACGAVIDDRAPAAEEA